MASVYCVFPACWEAHPTLWKHITTSDHYHNSPALESNMSSRWVWYLCLTFSLLVFQIWFSCYLIRTYKTWNACFMCWEGPESYMCQDSREHPRHHLLVRPEVPWQLSVPASRGDWSVDSSLWLVFSFILLWTFLNCTLGYIYPH